MERGRLKESRDTPDSPQLLGLEQPLKYFTDKDKESVSRFLFEYAIAKNLLSNPKDGLLGRTVDSVIGFRGGEFHRANANEG